MDGDDAVAVALAFPALRAIRPTTKPVAAALGQEDERTSAGEVRHLVGHALRAELLGPVGDPTELLGRSAGTSRRPRPPRRCGPRPSAWSCRLCAPGGPATRCSRSSSWCLELRRRLTHDGADLLLELDADLRRLFLRRLGDRGGAGLGLLAHGLRLAGGFVLHVRGSGDRLVLCAGLRFSGRRPRRPPVASGCGASLPTSGTRPPSIRSKALHRGMPSASSTLWPIPRPPDRGHYGSARNGGHDAYRSASPVTLRPLASLEDHVARVSGRLGPRASRPKPRRRSGRTWRPGSIDGASPRASAAASVPRRPGRTSSCSTSSTSSNRVRS